MYVRASCCDINTPYESTNVKKYEREQNKGQIISEAIFRGFKSTYHRNLEQCDRILCPQKRCRMMIWVLSVRNHVKLMCVINSRRGFSKGTALSGRSLGDCRPGLPKGRKYQMVKTQTESHVRRPVV